VPPPEAGVFAGAIPLLRNHASRTKEFTEPVTLSSTCHIDLPLARSACVTGFDLLASRARCTANLRGGRKVVKSPWLAFAANCGQSVHAVADRP